MCACVSLRVCVYVRVCACLCECASVRMCAVCVEVFKERLYVGMYVFRVSS